MLFKCLLESVHVQRGQRGQRGNQESDRGFAKLVHPGRRAPWEYCVLLVEGSATRFYERHDTLLLSVVSRVVFV